MKDLIDYSRETGTGPMGKLNATFFWVTFVYSFYFLSWVMDLLREGGALHSKSGCKLGLVMHSGLMLLWKKKCMRLWMSKDGIGADWF